MLGFSLCMPRAGAEARILKEPFAARLKTCPDTKHEIVITSAVFWREESAFLPLPTKQQIPRYARDDNFSKWAFLL